MNASERRQDHGESWVPADTRGIRVLERSVYRGPNIHSARAMVRIPIDLGEFEHWPTDRPTMSTDDLLELLPGLARHGGEVSLRMAKHAVASLSPGGRLVHYTGSAIMQGNNALRSSACRSPADAG